eukprot:jgi/Botrbrau1/12108/Bobra.0186s0029.1
MVSRTPVVSDASPRSRALQHPPPGYSPKHVLMRYDHNNLDQRLVVPKQSHSLPGPAHSRFRYKGIDIPRGDKDMKAR